jgi:hypothetical protein
MRYDLTPPPSHPAKGPLPYATSLTDSKADLFSADREMTWRLARANGWAAVGIGALAAVGVCIVQSPIAARFTARDVVASLAIPAAMMVPGLVLLWVAGRVRGGGRGAVIGALAAGVWLACTWLLLAAGILLAALRGGAGRADALLGAVGPVAALACLLIPAGKLVYHATRVLALGGRAGMRDQTSGLDVAITATDPDLWRLVARVSLLRLAGSCVLLAVAGACLAAALIQRPPPPPEPAPEGTVFEGDLYASHGVPGARRQQIVDTFDHEHLLRPEQRQQLDDLLRHVGALFDTLPAASGFAWGSFVQTKGSLAANPAGPVDREFEIPSVALISWRKGDPGFSASASNGFYSLLRGDTVWLTLTNGSESNREWSCAAVERWVLSIPRAGGRQPTREQVEALRQLVPVPEPPREEPIGPPPVLPALDAALLDDGTLRVQAPDGETRYFDPDGSPAVGPWSQRQAEAEAARPKLAWLPISPASPVVLGVLAIAGIVAAYRAIAESRPGRRGEPVQLTEAAARRLLVPQTVLSLVSALAVLVVAWHMSARNALPAGLLISMPAALLALAAAGWVYWTAIVLPGRAIALAREQ